MTNKVFLAEDGTIWLVYDGYQDGAAARSIFGQMDRLVDQAKIERRPINIMVDATRFTSAGLEARQIAARALRQWPYRKIAIFGANTYLRHLVNMLIAATGTGGRVKVHATQAEAEGWLYA